MLKKILIISALFVACATNYFIKSHVTTSAPQLSANERTQIIENKIQQLTPPGIYDTPRWQPTLSAPPRTIPFEELEDIEAEADPKK